MLFPRHLGQLEVAAEFAFKRFTQKPNIKAGEFPPSTAAALKILVGIPGVPASADWLAAHDLTALDWRLILRGCRWRDLCQQWTIQPNHQKACQHSKDQTLDAAMHDLNN